MKNKITTALKVTALALVLSFGISYVYAWTAPTATPPGGNVAAPINTSGTAQTKTGNLTAGNLTAVSTSTANKAVVAPKYCIGANCITAWPTAIDTSAFLDKSATAQTKVGNLSVWGFVANTVTTNIVTTNALRIPGGTVGMVLTLDSSGNAVWKAPTAGVAPSGTQKFTSSGTFTVPAGVTQVSLNMSGGGGGGGSGAGGGGGGSETKTGAPVTVTAGGSYAITIGTGGAGAGQGVASGNNGGNTSFGSLLTTIGGKGGVSYSGSGGAAGGPGGLPGICGGSCSSIFSTTFYDGGAGGSSTYGTGGAGAFFGGGNQIPSVAGSGYGAGGGGGSSGINTISGAKGSSGFVQITW